MNNHRKSAVRTVLTLSLLSVLSTARADVSVDENGVGFVGKGDVQSIFDWNNAMLQENAGAVVFRFASGGGAATWQCHGVNPQGHAQTTSHSEIVTGLSSTVNFDARKNKQGQVTGFILNGIDGGQSEYAAVATCPYNRNWQVQRTYVEGSLVVEGGDPVLQVSVDGQEWHDLAITY